MNLSIKRIQEQLRRIGPVAPRQNMPKKRTPSPKRQTPKRRTPSPRARKVSPTEQMRAVANFIKQGYRRNQIKFRNNGRPYVH